LVIFPTPIRFDAGKFAAVDEYDFLPFDCASILQVTGLVVGEGWAISLGHIPSIAPL
jgi:hypothetical protein